MPAANLDQGFGFLLNDVSRLLRREFERRVSGFGLTRPQWILLSYVARHPGSTLGDLARIVEREKITISRQVSRMAKNGWLQQCDVDGAADVPAHGLQLTRKGEDIVARLVKVADQLRDDALAILQTGRREALIDDLVQVRANLERMIGAPG
jgi:DNA-binding MarR family transcriptional regulator